MDGKIKTVKVKHPECEGFYLIVNEEDASNYEAFSDEVKEEDEPKTEAKPEVEDEPEVAPVRRRGAGGVGK